MTEPIPENRKKPPSLDQWRDLYLAMDRFSKLKPWEWMYDDEIFCVEDPIDQTMYYCSITGGAKSEYGLLAFVGDYGLKNLFDLVTLSDHAVHPAQFMAEMDMLSGVLDARERVAKEDRETMKQLGLSYRGKKAWPVFMRFRTGLRSAPFDEKDCLTYTNILEQAVIVTEAYKNKAFSIITPSDHEDGIWDTVCRYQTKGSVEEKRWEQKKIRVDFPVISLTVSSWDVKSYAATIRTRKKWNGDLLAVFVYAPMLVRHATTHIDYFPQMIYFVDDDNGLVESFDLEDEETPFDITATQSLGALIKKKGKPQLITTNHIKGYVYIKEFCACCGIDLELDPENPAFFDFLERMEDMFPHT